MRIIALMLFMLLQITTYAQTYVEYISEKEDSMALINKKDVDKINNVFAERNLLDSLNTLNEKIIVQLEHQTVVKDSIIVKQIKTINNDKLIVEELENRNIETIEKYSKDLKREKNQKISFQTLSGISIVAIILLILI